MIVKIKSLAVDSGDRYPSLPLLGYISVDGETFYVDIVVSNNLNTGCSVLTIMLREYYKNSKFVTYINNLVSGKQAEYIHVDSSVSLFSMKSFGVETESYCMTIESQPSKKSHKLNWNLGVVK